MNDLSQELLMQLAPGTAIRDGLERIRRGGTGALIVMGFDDEVASICDGGFDIDVPFAPTRLRELCKMDGAVVLSADATRIRKANVQLVPDPSLPTEESGTRHRSAERTALQTGCPVISVSQSMNLMTVYVDGVRHVLKDSSEILSHANQALSTIERYRARFDADSEALFTAEIDGYASAAEVLGVLRLSELLRRAAETISRDVIELGSDGHQLDLQLRELVADTESNRRLLLFDYLLTSTGVPSLAEVDDAQRQLSELQESDLVGAAGVAQVLGFPSGSDSFNGRIDPRGYRALARIPRVPISLMEKVIDRYVTLPSLFKATREDLEAIEGVGPLWAGHVRQGLDRLK